MMIYLTAALAYLVALAPTSNSYNIDDGGGGFKVMGERAASFFGYNLRISQEGNDFRLLVGAPKSTKSSNSQPVNTSSPLAEGSIESCGLQNFIESSVNCISVAPPTASPGDSYGLSLDVATDSTLHVCSPTKMQSCPPVAYSPGYCFRRSEETRNWTEGPQTEKTDCSLVSLDIVILLDGSLSVGRVNFELVKQWTINVSRSFDIADGSTEIGVIQYSHHYSQQDLNEQDYIVTEISLGQYRSQSQFEDAVEMIRLHSFTTYTAHALNKSVYDFQSSPRYSDPRTAKVMILLTDGRSSDNEFLPYSANYLRSLGIRTFAIGVGRAVRDELQIIANGNGTDDRVFYVTNFEDLSKIISALRTEILSFALEGVREGGGAMTSVHHLQFGEKGFSLNSGLIGISSNIVIETMQSFSKLSSVAKEEISVNILRICRNQASAINILTLILNDAPYNMVRARKRALVEIVDYEEEQSWDNNSSEDVLLPRVRNRRIIQVDITGGNLLDDLGAIQHQLDSITATLDHPTGDTCDVTD